MDGYVIVIIYYNQALLIHIPSKNGKKLKKPLQFILK